MRNRDILAAMPSTSFADTAADAETDAELAARLAAEAGALLVALRDELFDAGAPYWHVMDAGDELGHRYINGELRRCRPGDAILDEEGREDPRRFGADRVWIIDPLDGTREFGEPGRPDWAVHVALWGGDRFLAGAVALPAIGTVLATHPPAVVPDAGRARPRIITSRSRAPYAAVLVANALECDAVRLGSAGAKAMAVVLGEADLSVHDGGLYQWDSAAPVAVATAAGLHTSRIDGSPLVYNDPDPWLPDLLICRPELAEPALQALWGDGHLADR